MNILEQDVNKTTSNKLLRKTIKKIKEKGCVEPLKGKKAKCVLKIVPQEKSVILFKLM